MSCTFNQLCPVLFGAGAAAETGRVAKEQGITRALIMADPKVVELGLTKKIEASLDEAGIPYVIYDGIETDAPDYTVVAAGKMGEEFGADGIIGIGGGSTLDAAKAASVLNGSDIGRDELLAPIPQFRPQVKNIMIPTTSGTGSENTAVAVVTNTETHYKTGVFALSHYAIVDPEMTYTVPRDATLYTGIDAMSHANEALCSAMNPNPNTDILAYDVFDRVFHWLPVAADDPENAEARENLAIASNAGGRAFADAPVHLGHAMAHAMGANYHIPHGYGCAWVTPVIIEYMADACPKKYLKVAKLIDCELSMDDPAVFPHEIAEYLRAAFKKWGLPTPKDLGFKREDFLNCTEYTKNEIMSTFGLKKPTEDEIRELLGKVYDTYC